MILLFNLLNLFKIVIMTLVLFSIANTSLFYYYIIAYTVALLSVILDLVGTIGFLWNKKLKEDNDAKLIEEEIL